MSKERPGPRIKNIGYRPGVYKKLALLKVEGEFRDFNHLAEVLLSVYEQSKNKEEPSNIAGHLVKCNCEFCHVRKGIIEKTVQSIMNEQDVDEEEATVQAKNLLDSRGMMHYEN